MTWTRYRPGDEVGGLTVIKPKGTRTMSSQQRYLVLHGCCNETAEISHQAIQRRVKRGITLCGVCAKRHNGENYGNPKK